MSFPDFFIKSTRKILNKIPKKCPKIPKKCPKIPKKFSTNSQNILKINAKKGLKNSQQNPKKF